MKTLIALFVSLVLVPSAFSQSLDFSPNHSVVLCGPTDVYFVCQSDQTVHNISWDFGDGSTGMGLSTVHRYTQTGIYDVKMVVEKNGLKDSVIKTAFVTVNPLPDASFEVSQESTYNPFKYVLNYTGAPDSLPAYRWKVDGALVSTQADCKYVFPDLGFYLVSLEVSNWAGCSVERDTIVEVTDVPIQQTALNETHKQPVVCSFDPTRNQLYIQRTGNSADKVNIRVFDITGKLLNEYVMSASSYELSIDCVGEWPPVVIVVMETVAYESVRRINPICL